MHSAPPTARVKTRVFRDCRFAENRRAGLRPDLPLPISQGGWLAPVNAAKPGVYGGKHLSKTCVSGLDGEFGVTIQ
jgi:hypothetical protein